MVIFDEASQICPEDAIGAIARGKQLIVVGDEHQLPPTRFFNASMGDGTVGETDQNGGFDSILDQCCTIGMPEVMLS
ncbi:MAG: putative DNA helicase, partial [Promethearchaeota archaeon CR_4]